MSTGTSARPWLPYSMAFIAASLTAVLRRSSRADGSPRSATAAATRSMARRSLPSSPGTEKAVTGRPSDRRRRRRHAGGAAEGDERDVVLLLPCRAGEPVQRVEQPVEQLAAGVVDGHLLAQAREAVHLLVGVVGLDEAVGVEQDVAARVDDPFGLLVDDARQQPERHPGGAQLDDAVVGPDVRQVVPGVGHDDPARSPAPGSRTGRSRTSGPASRARAGRWRDARITAGESLRDASARRIECVRAMTSAAGTPLSVTSPTAMPMRPPGISMKS